MSDLTNRNLKEILSYVEENYSAETFRCMYGIFSNMTKLASLEDIEKELPEGFEFKIETNGIMFEFTAFPIEPINN